MPCPTRRSLKGKGDSPLQGNSNGCLFDRQRFPLPEHWPDKGFYAIDNHE
jgi:hypothetical protein